MSKKATRKSFGEALLKLGQEYPNIVCLDADLSKSTQSCLFAQEFPDRFFEMGIQEANMIGAAAGMSFAGKIPFICSFAAFITGRFDQIRMSIGYSGANVKIIGTHSGVGIGEDGHSQMGLEDIALMRTIPSMCVLQPSDEKECHEMMKWTVDHTGPVYLRLTRQGLSDMDMPAFQLGVFPQLRKGEKVAFLANAGLLENTLLAANKLSEMGALNPAVYNASTAKPLNQEFMQSLTDQYQELVVFEDHNVIGGTGAAIAEWVCEHSQKHIKVRRWGVQDTFGESGTPQALYDKHHFTTQKIVSAWT